MNAAIAAGVAEAKGYADSLATNYDAAGTAESKMNELANGQVKLNKEAIETLNGASTVAGSVDAKIAAAKTELEGKITNSQYNDTQVKADIAANAAAIAVLNGGVTEAGSVKKEVADQIAAIVNDNDASSINTLEEIAAWIGDHPDNAAAMNAKIVANGNAISALQTYVGEFTSSTATTVVGYVDEKVAALGTQVASDIATAKGEAISEAATDATTKANKAKDDAIAEATRLDGVLETSLKAYADEEDAKIETRVGELETKIGSTGDVTTAISNAQEKANDAYALAKTADGKADTNAGNITNLTGRVAALEGIVGEGTEAIPNSVIDALFQTA